MALSPDIRDQAYQFFIEEAPELLQAIEAGLLTLREERSTNKVHTIMRSAHSLKGGASSVDLEAIAALAHRLEHIFKALYDQTIEIDTDLESQLLQAYDCLRLPLMEQIRTGHFNTEEALVLAEPIFMQIEERLGEALTQGDNYIPSSSDLGVDMAQSIFEIDVQQGLERLTQVLAHPSEYEVVGELRAQVEVFLGFAELLNQPEFGAIASTVLTALSLHPEVALEITQLALTDFQRARQVILAGVTSNPNSTNPVTPNSVIHPCAALVSLANSTSTEVSKLTQPSTTQSSTVSEPIVEDGDWGSFGIDNLFINTHSSVSSSSRENWLMQDDVLEDTEIERSDWELDQLFPVHSDEFNEHSHTYGLSEDTAEAEANQQLEDIFNLAHEYGIDESAIASENDAETETPNFSEIIDVSWIDNSTPATTKAAEQAPLWEEVFGSLAITPETETDNNSPINPFNIKPSNPNPSNFSTFQPSNFPIHQPPKPNNLEEAVQSIEQLFDSLPSIQDNLPSPNPRVDSTATTPTSSLKADSLVPIPQGSHPPEEATSATNKKANSAATDSKGEASPTPHLSVRVDSERLDRINNLVGELSINRNGLSLQNEQLQGSVRELLNRFVRVQDMVGHLRKLSDQMLVTPERFTDGTLPRLITQLGDLASFRADFDALELDNYSLLQSQLQGLLEDMMQLEESVEDIVLFAKATDQTLEQQRQMLTQLRDELLWARMLPLGEILNRFPRVLRDLSTTYHKPVSLKLTGTSVLVDKAVLDKLYDPLLHLLRNAFDHGIEEFSDIRRQQRKPETGQIEIRAYHQGSQTIIEVRDDGQGLNLERIRERALEMGLFTASQLATISSNRLYELIFEPGFSTAKQVSKLSGRGVGLDVVRAQMRSLKGSVSVISEPGIGTTFTLRLPLTLTIAKLLVCFIGSTALALPSDSVEEIIVPRAGQVQESGSQRFLQWRGQIVPAYRLADLLHYNCPLSEASPSKALFAVPSPQNWALPMLLLRQDGRVLALEIDRLVTEQELVIKPFGSAIAPPGYTYGCTILGDGSLIPVIDAAALSEKLLGLTAGVNTLSNFQDEKLDVRVKSLPPAHIGQANQRLLTGHSPVLESQNIVQDGWRSGDVRSLPSSTSVTHDYSSNNPTREPIRMLKAPTILVVDDAVALRRTLALTLERAGCRVLQAPDGREAIEVLQHSSSVKLVVCDVEMPNMNGFEFLGYRRQDPNLSQIPIVMLTSRSNDKHRWLAMQLGATAYFTKPYLEQEFVGAIKEIINQNTPENLSALQVSI